MVYMYNKKLPRKDDLVFGEIFESDNFGIKVKLLDYNDVVGFISINETSRIKRKQSKSIAIGVKTTFIVIAVDEIKGFIDLSKHNISKDEAEAFDLKRKSHILLFNFFKYILMKLKKYENINMILEDELQDFMTRTLWEIQQKFDNNENIHTMLFDASQNEQVIEEINYEGATFTQLDIKSIIDNYITTKLNQSKASGRKGFKLLSYKISGAEDIRHVTDIKTFNSYEELSKNYDVKILYETNTDYTIYLEQKAFSDEDVNPHIEILVDEIKNRAKEREVKFYI